MRENRLLIVFVKAPRPGSVKTRLAATLGADGACDAYERMVSHLLRQLRPLRTVQLRFTPDDAEHEVRWWLRPRWRLAPQGEGDLGVRLCRAFAEAFAAGNERVAVIGSDCPFITVEDIEQAWTELDRHDVVLGPARDGGYWLVALRAPAPDIFREIPWSTVRVLEATLERVHAAGLRMRLLRELRDIDTVEDLRLFLARK